MKTDEELERMAYINGHPEIAELLARVIDAEEEIERLEGQLTHDARQVTYVVGVKP